jgi:hypothetical protein
MRDSILREHASAERHPCMSVGERHAERDSRNCIAPRGYASPSARRKRERPGLSGRAFLERLVPGAPLPPLPGPYATRSCRGVPALRRNAQVSLSMRVWRDYRSDDRPVCGGALKAWAETPPDLRWRKPLNQHVPRHRSVSILQRFLRQTGRALPHGRVRRQSAVRRCLGGNGHWG